jgi:putative ABC transport system permease protein
MITLFDRDSWQEIFLTLEKNPLRTLLTAFGVFWGILMLVLLIGTGQGFKTAIMHNFESMATNSMFIWPERTTIPYKGLPRNREYNFTTDDVAAIRDVVKGIKHLVPQMRWATILARRTMKGDFTITGTSPEIQDIEPLDLPLGRFVNQIDMEQKRKIAVIGKKVHLALFKPGENPIGQFIQMGGVQYQVIGVFQSRHEGEWGNWQNGLVFLPLSTMQEAFNLGNRIGFLAMEAEKGMSATTVGEEIKSLLKERHRIAPDDKLAINENNVESDYRKLVYLFTGVEALIWVIGIGTLLSGIIGVSNIMLFTVKARTHEIGIRRVLGATPIAVISQVLMESLLLTAIAGVFGLGLGIAALSSLYGIETPMFRHPDISSVSALSSLGIIMISSLAAGLLPASRAVSLKPIEAIRDIT